MQFTIPDQALISNGFNAESRAKAITTSIPANVNFVLTGGYAASGDGGGARYKRVVAQPAHIGKFQSADGAWWEIDFSQNLNNLMFGMVTGSSSDQSSILNSIFALTNIKAITFISSDYVVTSLITFNCSNVVYNATGTVKFISSLNNGFRLAVGTSNITFNNIQFWSSLVSNVEDNLALVYFSGGNGQTVSNITFNNCYFSTPNCGVTGFKFFFTGADNNAGLGFNFFNCTFENLGRMGIEFQGPNATNSYADVTVRGCNFKNTGALAAGTYGMGVSFAGKGQNIKILNNTFTANKWAAIEFTDTSNSIISGNTFFQLGTYSCRVISITPVNPVSGNCITNNVCGDTTSAVQGTIVNKQTNLIMSGNTWRLNGVYFEFASNVRLRCTGDSFITSANVVVYFTGSGTEYNFDQCVFDNSANATNSALLRAFNTTTDTINVVNCDFVRTGTTGVLFDYQSSPNTVFDLQLARTNNLNSFTASKSIFRTVSSGSVDTIVIDLAGQSGSWQPFVIDLKISTVKNDSTGPGYVQLSIFGRNNNANIVIFSTTEVVAKSGLTYATSISGTKLTITTTNSVASGPNLGFTYDCKVSNNQVASIV